MLSDLMKCRLLGEDIQRAPERELGRKFGEDLSWLPCWGLATVGWGGAGIWRGGNGLCLPPGSSQGQLKPGVEGLHLKQEVFKRKTVPGKDADCWPCT